MTFLRTIASKVQVQDFVNNVPDLLYKKVPYSIWISIKKEGLDDEFGVEKEDWSYAKLPIPNEALNGLKNFDPQWIEFFNSFDIELKNKHGKKYTDLINYDIGEVTIVRVDSDIDMKY